MNNVIVQIGYSTTGGGLVPLALSRDPSLARTVARHIIDELSQSNFEDEVLDDLAKKERKHIANILTTLGIEISNNGN
jgi:hypothetical protein